MASDQRRRDLQGWKQPGLTLVLEAVLGHLRQCQVQGTQALGQRQEVWRERQEVWS